MRRWLMTVAAAALLVTPLAATAEGPVGQVTVDRILVRVNGRVLTQSDVRQARLLKLVDDTSSDASTQRELENRLLIQAEVARVGAMTPATDSDIAARRAEWEASIGDAGRVPELLQQAGMSDADLQSWLRDDLRVRAYMKRQFGHVAASDLARAKSDWIARLRDRAGLK